MPVQQIPAYLEVANRKGRRFNFKKPFVLGSTKCLSVVHNNSLLLSGMHRGSGSSHKCPLCPSQAQLQGPRASQCSQGCCKDLCLLVSPPSSLKTALPAEPHALRSLCVSPKPEEPWPKGAKGKARLGAVRTVQSCLSCWLRGHPAAQHPGQC